MFTKLSDEATKELELITIRIENVTPFEERRDLHWSILNWYERHNVKINGFKKGEKVLTKLLGHTPNYKEHYEQETIVWGFEWIPVDFKKEECPNNIFTIYCTKDMGLTIQVHEKFNKDSLLPLFKLIHEKLL
jgi:hypothetical protein